MCSVCRVVCHCVESDGETGGGRMQTRLVGIQQRVADLDKVAGEVFILAQRLLQGETVQPELSIVGQRWYRGVRELMVQNQFSGLEELEQCYQGLDPSVGIDYYTKHDLSSMAADPQEAFQDFSTALRKARALLFSLQEELLSRQRPIRTQLSYEIVANEFDTAERMLIEGGQEEVFRRASGVLARLALERHLWTVADSRSIAVAVNPPSKRKADAQDVMNSLAASDVITGVQKSQLEALFKVGNNCAHPKEAVIYADVERLVRDGRALAALIV